MYDQKFNNIFRFWLFGPTKVNPDILGVEFCRIWIFRRKKQTFDALGILSSLTASSLTFPQIVFFKNLSVRRRPLTWPIYFVSFAHLIFTHYCFSVFGKIRISNLMSNLAHFHRIQPIIYICLDLSFENVESLRPSAAGPWCMSGPNRIEYTYRYRYIIHNIGLSPQVVPKF